MVPGRGTRTPSRTAAEAASTTRTLSSRTHRWALARTPPRVILVSHETSSLPCHGSRVTQGCPWLSFGSHYGCLCRGGTWWTLCEGRKSLSYCLHCIWSQWGNCLSSTQSCLVPTLRHSERPSSSRSDPLVFTVAQFGYAQEAWPSCAGNSAQQLPPLQSIYLILRLSVSLLSTNCMPASEVNTYHLIELSQSSVKVATV